MANLFQKVNAVAQQIQPDLSDLEANIQASCDWVEKGAHRVRRQRALHWRLHR